MGKDLQVTPELLLQFAKTLNDRAQTLGEITDDMYAALPQDMGTQLTAVVSKNQFYVCVAVKLCCMTLASLLKGGAKVDIDDPEQTGLKDMIPEDKEYEWLRKALEEDDDEEVR